MHGRLKIRTTEEEQELKKKKQALQVQLYRTNMKKIIEKRSRSELDDEMLHLTYLLLTHNPDIITLWNIRRECILLRSQDFSDNEKELDNLYSIELTVAEQCLTKNPKSYCAWHHRCWALENTPNPNWDRELHTINTYLKLDERNFHTWDYRRYIAMKAGIDKEKELDFCTEKIKANFSNYSSWHYRSKLLPELYPYKGDAASQRPMNEEKLKEELEMVLAAAFTDPNDSSAWFYQRWLLGYSRQELDICAFRCDKTKAVLAFTQPIVLPKTAEIFLFVNEEKFVLTGWQALRKTEADALWIATLATHSSKVSFDDSSLNYRLDVNIFHIKSKTLSLTKYSDSVYYFNPPNRSVAFSTDVIAELQSQLESCESLLEYEPDSKWTLLTIALLMRGIDRQKYHNKSLENLEKLQKVDALREGYYKDLASKWIWEKLLNDWLESKEIPKKFELKCERAEQLTSIYYEQYLSIADGIVMTPELEKIYKERENDDRLKTFVDIKL